MTVAKFVQTDFTTQDPTTYKSSIDANNAVAKPIVNNFACHAQDTPNMTVLVEAGTLGVVGTIPVQIAAQNSAALTAPSINPRNDIVYVDALTGVIGVATGAEAASPVDPAIPGGKIPLARLAMFVSMMVIANSEITDLRGSVLAQDVSFPSGTKMVFAQPSAPAGWVQDTTQNDRVLRVVSNAGGGVGGNWAISGLSSTTSVTVNGHSLAAGEIPAHTHNASGSTSADGSHAHTLQITSGLLGGGGDPNFVANPSGIGTVNTDAVANHSHTISFATDGGVGLGGAAHSHTASGSSSVSADGNWRPAYQDVIVCTKN